MIDVISGKPVASDFWLAQKNAVIRCSLVGLISNELHQTRRLTTSKTTTVLDITVRIEVALN